MVDGIEWLFNKTAVKTGKGAKSKRCIKFYNDLEEKQEEMFLKTREDDEPILVVFRRKNVFYSSYIIGDENIIYTEADNMAHSLILLAGIYRIAEIDVPKSFYQFIGILNSLIFCLPWNTKDFRQSSGYVQTKDVVEAEMKRGNISRGLGKQR